MKKHLLICFVIFALCIPFHALANPVEEWTLATVPSLEHSSANENVHEIRIVTTNSDQTEMYIEKSNDKQNFDVLQDWISYRNGDLFTTTLNEGETIYLRIKARNANGIETGFSDLLQVNNKPGKPVTRGQHSTDVSVTIDFDPAAENNVYWVHRLDKPEPEKVSSFPYIDNTVLPARQYTYEFWLDNNGVISDKNRITLWTKPQKPLVTVKEVTASQVVLAVDTLNNPSNILIEAQDTDDKALSIEGKQVKATGLMAQTDYTIKVRLKSANDEYTDWVETKAKTKSETSETGVSINQQEKLFKEKAMNIIAELFFETDGEVNSSSAWIKIRLEQTTSYKIVVTVDDETKILSNQTIQFNNLKDNQLYNAQITISNGQYEYQEIVEIHTPNRTPPKIQSGFFDTSEKVLIIQVESVNGVEK